MDVLTVSVKTAQTFEATTIRGKRGTFITYEVIECFTIEREAPGKVGLGFKIYRVTSIGYR